MWLAYVQGIITTLHEYVIKRRNRGPGKMAPLLKRLTYKLDVRVDPQRLHLETENKMPAT